MKELVIAGHTIKPGSRTSLDIPVAKLYTDTGIYIPVHVIRAKKEGPTVFVSAAIHGDELNGIEIVRRLIQSKNLKVTQGTLILVPMVNVYGVLNQSRYMPDRRDLNRCFPGSAKGSLAGRLANIFLEEIVYKCDYGIDLHTGAIHRSNLPQVRADMKDPETRHLAECFGVPVLLNSDLRDGSLRHTAVEKGIRILLYEAGQALRYDEISIRAGMRGVINVLGELGMAKKRKSRRKLTPYEANNSAWVRAGESGIVNHLKALGDAVAKGEILATIGSPFGDVTEHVKANRAGIIIGKQNIPLVQEGDAMFHIAFFSEADDDIADTIGTLQETLMDADKNQEEIIA
ncbi:succinylglutamate desuccinylase/aspartoacylase family protein [Reinekea sp. G2M2-21]|jgi:predicted deacylase|uniref:succinylglutamate desuccinylase/aspartoacylase family protein n=1 Tax=Reinekea sp. G2M2-21 TaxID=2788942 RepID=UPI0018AAEFBA|nr:succinylglutamate desuccinylase/aspartoacylase family protein [Reinekea sp. G2M2-21]MDX1342426.1 succinylglutamate desuccinylase/aspartoacylase family protein [Reinekea sp.]MDX1472534.1 succinylglutamate desuccinylase/aspartoacylase family protein [Reinekea sp.]